MGGVDKGGGGGEGGDGIFWANFSRSKEQPVTHVQ